MESRRQYPSFVCPELWTTCIRERIKLRYESKLILQRATDAKEICMHTISLKQDEDPAHSVEQAAVSLGIDSFAVYELIRGELIMAERSSSGEMVIRQSELDRVLGKPSGKE
jgi:hypothetical protein